jgi:Remorin, C-terminal region
VNIKHGKISKKIEIVYWETILGFNYVSKNKRLCLIKSFNLDFYFPFLFLLVTGEDDFVETNPLAIVPDNNPIVSPHIPEPEVARGEESPVMVVQVKKEETETKISAWQSEEIAKLNNRFKREEVIINSWENEQVEAATARLKKTEVCFHLI